MIILIVGDGWARYDLARHGTFKLVPPDYRLAAIRADYEVMRPMFLHEPAPFEEIMRDLAEAETTINQL